MKLFFTLYLLFSTLLVANAQLFVKHDATGTNDGTSWTNAFTDLQDALDEADPGDQIWLAAGTYIPEGPTPDSSHFWMLTPVELYGGFAGTESNISERDWNTNLTILSGDVLQDDIPGNFVSKRTDNAHHVLIINAPIGETTVDGLLFQGGMTRLDAFAPNDATDIPYNRWRGGGLYIYKSTSTVRNCTFRDNYGTHGSGMFAAGDTAQSRKLILENSLIELNASVIAGACWISGWINAIISECVFQQNNSSSHSGAIALGNMHAIIENCSFNQNSATSLGGSSLIFNNALSSISHPTYQFKRCEFTGNRAQSGGAVRLNNFASSFSLAFDSCTFTRNEATTSFGEGGAILVYDYVEAGVDELKSHVRINHSTFTENTSDYGGGVEVNALDDSLDIEILNSGFFSNSAPISGGGLYIWMVNDAVVDALIDQVEFDKNSTQGSGGAIVFDNYQNTNRMSYNIYNSTFSNNFSQVSGGGIASISFPLPLGSIGSISNSVFQNNQSSGSAGAMYSFGESILIEESHFSGNNAASKAAPDYYGGGAIVFDSPEEAIVRNTIFVNNSSVSDGAGVLIIKGESTTFENVLLYENPGSNTIANGGNLKLINITMVDNDNGLLLQDSSITEIQNSIFDNVQGNLQTEKSAEIISTGGNISSDGTMSSVLTGFGSYEDLHNTDPMLGPDFYPLAGSPAIDAGNPEGNTSAYDLAGQPRIQGSGIDIGSYESFAVSIKEAVWDDQILKIFPNPAKETLNFEMETDWTGEFQLAIYNYLGQQIQHAGMFKSAKVQTFSQNISHIPPGEYVLMATRGEVIYASHIVIGR